jgi:hypothetical protein
MIPSFRRDFDMARDPFTAQNALRICSYQSWTPSATFVTPGDLSIAFANRAGVLLTIGKLQILNFSFTTSTFTHSTASGNFTITGVPAAPSGLISWFGSMGLWRGITKANYTQISPQMTSAAQSFVLTASGSGQIPANVTTADMPTGGTVQMRGQIIYLAA